MVVDLGLIGYAEACELQKRIVAARKAGRDRRCLAVVRASARDYAGAQRQAREFAGVRARVAAEGRASFMPPNRGGDITYHGPGQVVGYPVIRISARFGETWCGMCGCWKR